MMDAAERARLREAAGTILYENPPVMAMHAVEVSALLDALDWAEAERDAARAEVARLKEALKQARADVGGTASGLRRVKPSRLVMDVAANQLEQTMAAIHAALTATTTEERGNG